MNNFWLIEACLEDECDSAFFDLDGDLSLIKPLCQTPNSSRRSSLQFLLYSVSHAFACVL